MTASWSPLVERLVKGCQQAVAALHQGRTPQGRWEGRLSSSALSTATAVTALGLAAREGGESAIADRRLAEAGLRWLAQHVNADGGWGDTPESPSNISTTTLAWAAFGVLPEAEAQHLAVVKRAGAWIAREAGSAEPGKLADAITARYGRDRTFSVPILTLCALAGRLGQEASAWDKVMALPFEMAALPRDWFALARLPVVSYALPALIAMGQAHHHLRPSRNPLVRLLRDRLREPTLNLLTTLQPPGGGFLEATPLTSFVTMSLIGAGQAAHPVVREGLLFLRRSVRTDGSWPIDTNLATWVSTLAVNALASVASSQVDALPQRQELTAWLLGQQHLVVHPYTNAAPGGWAWTDLPGGVPDADDTPGALLALRHLAPLPSGALAQVEAGLNWLLDLQNRDGGVPTFCRGWGYLPFDRSSPDLTAHTLRAWQAWQGEVGGRLATRLERGSRRALRFLVRAQHRDGSWEPLWFGNQHTVGQTNPLYGTAKVVLALAEWPQPETSEPLHRAFIWLGSAQGADGGWGGAPGCPPSQEETALAVEALSVGLAVDPDPDRSLIVAWQRGVEWLLHRMEAGGGQKPSPIGLYFARLWYDEALYPVVFTVAALGRAARFAMSHPALVPGR